jgi:hypothetical protein
MKATTLISLLSFLLSLSSTGLKSQSIDHLSMMIDIDHSTLKVKAQYQAFALTETDSIYFLLNPGFELKHIEAPGLSAYQLSQKQDRPFPFWCLKFDHTFQIGEEVNIEFEYQFDLIEQNHLKSNWIELSVDKLWFPNHNDMDNKFTYDVAISNFPEHYTIISHTDAEITKKQDQIFIKKQTPWAEVLILAGADMKTWKPSDSLTIYAKASLSDSTLHSISKKVKHSIDFLNEEFGKSNPINTFTVVLRNTSAKELGYQFNRKNMIVTGVDFNNYADLSHEIAHYWWSDADFINEPWMNESFANYSMYLVLEKYTPDGYRKLFDRYRKRSEHAIPVMQAKLFTPDSYDSYYVKGSVLLKELEEKIGKDKLTVLLARRVEKNINSTTGFLEELEKLTDRKTRNFFEEILAR